MKVLMIGPDRGVQGGISSVVNSYYNANLNRKINLKYIGTVIDGNKFEKISRAIKSYIDFKKSIHEYELIHVHMASRASFYRKSIFIRTANKYNKKIIIHMHGAEFGKFYNDECNENQKKYIKKIFSYSDKVIALSNEWKMLLSNVCDTNKIEVVYNAVNLPERINKNYTNKSILFLGRLGKRKGVYDLLEVIPKLITKYPDIKFYLGGDGEISKVEKICKQKNIEKHVEILGWIGKNDKHKLLSDCSIYILPSYNEGMPMSILEAMSYANPVVSTYVGGIPEIITHNYNGLLFNAGDTEELFNCLDKILSNEEERNYMGDKALETIKDNFDMIKNIEKLIDIYNDTIKIDI